MSSISVNDKERDSRYGKKVVRPTRYSRALRRLLDGKTTTVVYRVAKDLERDGYVTIQGPPSSAESRPSIACTLTEAGKQAAEKAKKGVNPYQSVYGNLGSADRRSPQKGKSHVR